MLRDVSLKQLFFLIFLIDFDWQMELGLQVVLVFLNSLTHEKTKKI